MSAVPSPTPSIPQHPRHQPSPSSPPPGNPGPADRPGPGGDPLRGQLESLTTEAHRSDLAAIDRLPTLEIARVMNREDSGVPGAVEAVLPRIAAAIDAVAARMEEGGRLLYTGAGTAGRLGVLDASECPPTFNTDPETVVGLLAGGSEAMVSAVEGAEDDAAAGAADLDARGVGPLDTVVGVSASGRTPYAVGAVEHARRLGALTIGLACNPGTPLGAAAEHPIEVVVGPELITGSTRLKAGTAQKLVLNMISTVTMIRLGKTYGNLMVDVRATNDKLRARSRRIIALATGAPEPAIEKALAATGGEVKPAILMLLADVDADTAGRLLTDARGRLRTALLATGAASGGSAGSPAG
ncbi:N-acetylmuramic acid 6-phosphate etherase [Streptomyces sp. ST2-7A]|uniref:N-acetylmuramic acid 6-phosphate etherase n=1 Tax=Streptomyces sp. ST2-7A TaxID=2907214 RepID=UPI001F330074|nr:N-acetylmuramic acid 6-phosphate etherase [Streptomyces sp. ST2-7A]MCE7080183.1 N-acetylmuramic acid 6-phosphate etherase [Streptomyces sp. ST2-7A]